MGCATFCAVPAEEPPSELGEKSSVYSGETAPSDWIASPLGRVISWSFVGVAIVFLRLGSVNSEILPKPLKASEGWSAFPSIDIFAGTTPSSSDSRFLRRLVRDNQFRKLNPAATLELWPKVLEGEKKWIEPFRGNADAVFDSYLVYELAVLKPYVGGLLERARLEVGDTPQVMNMIRLLSAVDAASPNAVPGDSILRETIGGSQLEY